MCCHGSPNGLSRDVCRNTKSAPGSNSAPRRWLVLASTTCTYHACQTLNVYSRTLQRLRPRYTNSIIYASINIRAAHSSLHSFNVRIHSTFIYSLAQLLPSRFCVLNFFQTALFWPYNNFNLAYNLCSWRALNSYNRYGNTCAFVPFSELLEPQIKIWDASLSKSEISCKAEPVETCITNTEAITLWRKKTALRDVM